MIPWFTSILRRNWRPIAVPHYRLGFGDESVKASPWREALELADGSRTLSEISRLTKIPATELARQSRGGMLILWPDRLAPLPSKQPDIIILSPHLDDAALSLGGQMLQWKDRCQAVDVFSSVSWWRLPYDSPTDARIQQTRDAEEDLMSRLVGCHVRKLGFLEAPRRGYSLDQLFTAEISPNDEETRQEMRLRLRELINRGGQQWFLPLAVGHHVDHRLARDVALAELLAANVPADRIYFYEDLFYAAQTPGVADYASFIPGHRLKPTEQMPIDAKMKTRLLQVYGSQLTWAQLRMVRDYATRFGRRPVERVWKLA
jgi:LmbE family N-acetylglucosaminyl deacetylase